jgi:hypothetical protein
VRARWPGAIASCLILLAGGCGRIGVEILGDPASDDAGFGIGALDAESGLEPAPGLEPISGLEPLEDSGGPSVGGPGGNDAEAPGGDSGPDDPMMDATTDAEQPLVDAGPACIPLTSAELAALSRSACMAFAPCPGEMPPLDSDADRFPDACDPCRNDPDNDTDGDGYCTAADNCPAVANADQADNDADRQGDSCDSDDDNDGVADTTDNCRLVRNATQADGDRDGRGDACDSDLDGDAVPDATDNCPSVANPAQTNSDGAADGGDACDSDDDNDGILDGADNCPLVANPTQTNSDGADGGDACDSDDDNDGVADTADMCPFHAGKSAPGVCGCALPENCQALVASLAHRYRFEGTGFTLEDSVGGTNGGSTVALSGSGSLTLSGSAQYATFASQLLSARSTVTIEFWFTWNGGAQNQRALSFGTATPGALNVNCNGGSYCTGTSPRYALGGWYHFCNARICIREDAAAGCRNAGGTLMAINSLAEQQYLETHPDWINTSVWLGGNDKATEGQWYWSTVASDQGGPQFWSGGASGSPVNGAYTNWDDAEPSGTNGKDCAFVQKTSMRWWAWDCTGWGGHAICEWRGHQSASNDRGVWFTPSDGGNRPRLSYKASGTTSTVTGSSAFPVGTRTHVALVLNPAGNTIALYINGTLSGSVASTAPLAELRDGDNWLGRSQVASDPALNGSFSELRIYNRALTASELQTSVQAGPDPSFL